MNREQETATTQTSPRPYSVRLPGFVSDEEVGLGDVVKRMTYAIGIRPCGGCAERAAALNRWFVIRGQRK
ncbi:MAG: hypothetical protein L0Y50_08375 [Beijerinckiaceae bacterium]|nr:hypothetical protein [Beijerinckiaceae bacterium]MCI0736269.1 hypothetical protein [Beijerinckiaceae bacterium]